MSKSMQRKLAQEKRVRESIVRGEEIKGMWEAMLKVPEFQEIMSKRGVGLLEGDKIVSTFVKGTKRHKVGVYPETIAEKRKGGFAGKAKVLPASKIDRKRLIELRKDYFTKRYREIRKKKPKMTKTDICEIIGQELGFKKDYIRKNIKINEKKRRGKNMLEKYQEEQKNSATVSAFVTRGLLNTLSKMPEIKIFKEGGIQKIDKKVGEVRGLSGKTVKLQRLGKIGKTKVLPELDRGLNFSEKKKLVEKTKKEMKRTRKSRLLKYLLKRDREEYMNLRYGDESEKKEVLKRYKDFE